LTKIKVLNTVIKLYEIGNLVFQFYWFLQFLLYRFGYKDKVKQTGALPRLSEEAPKLEDQIIFEPEAQFAPCRALAGQNDYIDILGKFSPKHSF
jgi:hypothetical protein